MPHDPPAAYAGHLVGRRILVVENDRLMAEELQHGLAEQGAHVVGLAFTVDQALHYIDRHPYLDAVVLDVRLGEELSFPVADLLVERRVPFLFATAFPDWAIPSTYAGIARMRKPVNAAKVADVLVNALS